MPRLHIQAPTRPPGLHTSQPHRLHTSMPLHLCVGSPISGLAGPCHPHQNQTSRHRHRQTSARTFACCTGGFLCLHTSADTSTNSGSDPPRPPELRACTSPCLQRPSRLHVTTPTARLWVCRLLCLPVATPAAGLTYRTPSSTSSK
jgi:hypothetical protein